MMTFYIEMHTMTVKHCDTRRKNLIFEPPEPVTDQFLRWVHLLTFRLIYCTLTTLIHFLSFDSYTVFDMGEFVVCSFIRMAYLYNFKLISIVSVFLLKKECCPNR
jgi:hypothetical protein